jgi:serum/glucocorticoid-regulated kinase 2
MRFFFANARIVVLEFDKNEVLIDALGGEIAAPVWMYQTNL